MWYALCGLQFALYGYVFDFGLRYADERYEPKIRAA